MARKRLGEMLIEEGVLDEAGLRRGLLEQRKWGGQLGAVLVDLRIVEEKALVATLAKQLRLPVVRFEEMKPTEEVLALVSEDQARQHLAIPFKLDGKFLDVAMSDPTNLAIVDELRIRTQLNVRPYLIGPKTIARALERFYGVSVGGTSATFDVDDLESDFQAPDGIDIDLQPEVDGEQLLKQVVALQQRVSNLEALLARDEDVIRKMLTLLIDKGLATREEILKRIQ